jgi:hypothetical protein
MSRAAGVRKQYPPLGVPSLTSESLAPGEIVTANFDALDLTVLPELSRREAGRARDVWGALIARSGMRWAVDRPHR